MRGRCSSRIRHGQSILNRVDGVHQFVLETLAITSLMRGTGKGFHAEFSESGLGN